MKYEGREMEIGEPVRILREDESFSIGEYEGDITFLGRSNPQFKVGGGILYGFECFWIPEREALMAEEESNKQIR